MLTQLRTVGLGLLAVTLVSTVATSNAVAGPVIQFQPQVKIQPYLPPRLRPVPPPVVTPAPVVPRLGFMGHINYGYGMVVDRVSWGTFANRLGLERGDVIVRINNHSIDDDHDYNRAVRNAVEHQRGFIDMLVIDVRTGEARHRAGYLSAVNNGPIYPRSLPHINAQVGYSY